MYQQENIDFDKFKKRPKFLFDLLFYDETEEFHFSWLVEAESFEKAKEIIMSEIDFNDYFKVKISRVYLEIFNEEN